MRAYQPDERVAGTVYRIIRQIGSGGMGSVYEVEDTTIGKPYVLKTLQPQLGSRTDLARRMQAEARTLARLAHPHIVEVITAGVTGDDARLPFFVMERLSGQSLRSVIQKKGRLELPHAYHIALELLEALEHAHKNGVIHRDVKPDNIFLHRGPSGVTTTKLLDFGIVSLLDGVSRETQGRFLGTLRYAAPEQLRGDKPTPKVDIYAAGLVLFEMITGRGPFDDEGDSRQIASAHVSKQAPPISRFVSVPPALESVVASALAKSPVERPQDAYSFAAALRTARREFGVLPEDDTAAGGATDSGVIDSTSPRAPFVRVRQESPSGPIVVAPAGATPMADSAPSSGDPLPRTTIRGMAQPTAAEGEGASSSTATSPEFVDRSASTHTAMPAEARVPIEGTEPYLGGETTTAPYAMASRPGDEGLGDPTSDTDVGEDALSAGSPRSSRAFRLQTAAFAAGALLAIVALVSAVSVVRLGAAVAHEPGALPPASAGAVAPSPSAPAETTASIEPAPAPTGTFEVPSPSAQAEVATETPRPPPPRPEAKPALAAPSADTAKPPRAPEPARVQAPARAIERPGPGF